jgi:hypothetical protein
MPWEKWESIGSSKSTGRMGTKEHIHFLKSISSQSLLETLNNYQPMDTSGGTQVYQTRFGGRLDTKE